MFFEVTEKKEILDLMDNNSGPRFIYKHSMTCPTSILAKKQVESVFEHYPYALVVYIHVWDNRELSNRVEEYFDIVHESPQLITIQKGKVKDVKNHHSVTALYMLHILGGGYNEKK